MILIVGIAKSVYDHIGFGEKKGTAKIGSPSYPTYRLMPGDCTLGSNAYESTSFFIFCYLYSWLLRQTLNTSFTIEEFIKHKTGLDIAPPVTIQLQKEAVIQLIDKRLEELNLKQK